MWTIFLLIIFNMLLTMAPFNNVGMKTTDEKKQVKENNIQPYDYTLTDKRIKMQIVAYGLYIHIYAIHFIHIANICQIDFNNTESK